MSIVDALWTMTEIQTTRAHDTHFAAAITTATHLTEAGHPGLAWSVIESTCHHGAGMRALYAPIDPGTGQRLSEPMTIERATHAMLSAGLSRPLIMLRLGAAVLGLGDS
jgi:hypothetical protein